MSRQMKDSGVEWLGDIPCQWNIGRIGQLYSERREKVSDTEYEPLSVTMQGIVPQLSTAAKTDAHDDRKLVKKGDFAINSRSDRRGSCGVSTYDGSVSLINTILCPHDDMNAGYYNWLFHTSMFADEYYKWGHGIVNDLWTTGWQEMKRISIPVPTIDEQEKIATFLDTQCAHIDTVIEKTKASIEEYKKLKQAVITQAVTKGVRGDRSMKDSGIEWVDVFPSDWDIRRFKFVIKSLVKGNGITKDDVREDGDTPCVRYGEIYTKYDNSFDYCVSATNAEIVPAKQFFGYGDLLFTCTGELVEEIGKSIAYIGTDQCLAGGDIIIAKHSQNPVFLNYVMNSAYAQVQKSCDKTKLKVVHISASDIANVVIAIPDREEQDEIAQYLDDKCAEINKIIVAKQKQLDVITEFKKSLIYEYVTGKKEVPVS